MSHRFSLWSVLVLGLVALPNAVLAETQPAQISPFAIRQEYIGLVAFPGASTQTESVRAKAPCDSIKGSEGCSSDYLLKLVTKLEARVAEHIKDSLAEYYSLHAVCNANEPDSREVCTDAVSYYRGFYAQSLICHHGADLQDLADELLEQGSIGVYQGECEDLAVQYGMARFSLERLLRRLSDSRFLEAARAMVENQFLELALCEIRENIDFVSLEVRLDEVFQNLEAELGSACSPGTYLERRYGSQRCVQLLLPKIAEQAGSCANLLSN